MTTWKTTDNTPMRFSVGERIRVRVGRKWVETTVTYADESGFEVASYHTFSWGAETQKRGAE